MIVKQAERMDDIPFSGIRKVMEQVDTLKAQGRTIYPFYIGRPDFDTPQHIKDAAKQALDDGLIAYTSNYGLPELRQAIAAKLQKENHITADPDKEIIVTVGANEAVLMIMMGLLNPGDEVLIPDPMWLHYFYCARLAGARVVSVPLSETDGYQLNPDDIEKRITPRTKMIVVNTPHNPTGVVYTRETLEAVANIAAKHNLIVLSDEIYERIIFDGQEHISMATFPQIAGQVVTVNGFSKSYAMTGWRLGYVVAPPDITKMLIRVHQYTTVCATSFAQAGATAALTGPQESIDMMVGKFDERRKVIIDTFAQMPGAGLVKPTGAFYTFPNLSAIDPSSEVIAQKLLAATGVAVVPGSAFGEAGEGHVRLAYSASLANVTDGMAALKDYWLKHVVGHV
jgi:aspartate/methionine/tyrosine aminotransferase